MAARLRRSVFPLCFALVSLTANGQSPGNKHPEAASQDRANRVAQIIDQAVTPSTLPAGFKGMIVGYLDEFGPVYKTYGIATVDGTVPLNEKTVFGIGSATKLFAATLLAVANGKGLALDKTVVSLLPSQVVLTPQQNRAAIRLLDLADHHAGLPKNEGHLYGSLTDLYTDYAADPITCTPSTQELIHDCGCCDPAYMSLLGLTPTCGTGVANPVYSCATHKATQGPAGWVYSNVGFQVLGATVATWLGYKDWNTANAQEITVPLNMADTMPLELFGASQIARAANHCSPATRATNTNCQLLDWLPVGNAGGGLFSTASDMLLFASYNAFGTTDPAAAKLSAALPVIHQTYERSPSGGQELGWQNFTLATGEVEHWKDGSNGPFNSWTAYVTGALPRAVVILDNSGASAADLGVIAKQILVNTGPVITSVNTANGTADITQNDWIEIKGTNLVPSNAPAAGVFWSDAPEFARGVMPTKVGNVSVTVNGKPGFVWFYCSAATSACAADQINVLTPLDTASGPVQIVVTNSGVVSPAFTVNMKAVNPALLRYSGTSLAYATHLDYSLLGPTSLYPGATTPGKPGETILLYGFGFGLPSTALTNGSATQAGTLPALPVCQIGGTQVTSGAAGLLSPGFYIIAVAIPSGAPDGNVPVSCTYSGVSTPAGSTIAVQK